MLWESFFDDELSQFGSQGYSIWKKTDSKDIPDVHPEEIIFEGHLNKIDSKESPELKERYFILTADKLVYKKVIDDPNDRRNSLEGARAYSSASS